jgi:hypothetical protein
VRIDFLTFLELTAVIFLNTKLCVFSVRKELDFEFRAANAWGFISTNAYFVMMMSVD